MGRAERITEYIKRYDHELYCEDREGKLCIYRKGSRVEYYDVEGDSYGFVRPDPHFVLALTHNWKQSGYPVEWGLHPIYERLQSSDLWKRDMVSEIEENYAKKEQSDQRKLSNDTESFLKDFRRSFAKSFDDVNTSAMDKTKDSRRIKDVSCK